MGETVMIFYRAALEQTTLTEDAVST
jgi:hypothetical protein